MKNIIFIVTVLCSSLAAHSQDFASNALLFSRTQSAGSARLQGLGGAKTALGGDHSSAFVNPAGLGFYNRNEATLTAGLNFITSTSNFFNTSSEKESRSIFNIPGISLVLHTPSHRSKGFLGGSFALTLTRTNDFNQDFRYQGYNDQNSIIDYFIEDAGTIDPDELLIIDDIPGSYFYSLTGLAYNNFLIEDIYDDNDNLTGYETVLGFSEVRQEEISQRKGAQSQWSISYGANFNDKLFVGATIGIASIRFKQSQVYKEDDFDYFDDAPNALENFSAIEKFDIRGSGVNFSLGTIYRPVDFIQFGASFVTPTYYGLTDKYDAEIQSNWNNFAYFPDDPNDRLNYVSQKFPEAQIYEYNLSTPLKARLGIAVIQKFGLISFDAEYVNYSKAKYSSELAGEFQFENSEVRNAYKGSYNYSGGLEFRHDYLRFRAGANYMADPFQNSDDLDRSLKTVSGGVGVRLEKFFLDLAVNHSWTEARRIPYFTDFGAFDPLATMKLKSTKYALTFGFNF
jgi:hypothetical protein